MRKSILALAAVVAAGTIVQVLPAQARGLRVGFGYGMGSGGLSPLADASILERAHAQQAKNRRDRSTYNAPSTGYVYAIEKRRAAQAAAAAEKRQAARARAEKAEAEQAARRQAAARRKNEVVKAPVSVPAVTPSSVSGGDKGLEAAQQEQRAKAEELLRKLNGQASVPASNPPAKAAEPVIQPAATPAKVVVTPPPPPAAAPAQAPAQTSSAGECRRFIPGAGVTVRVSCSE